MKIKNYMLVVKDLEKSKDFYWKVLGLRTLADMGIHAVLTGGLALQTEGSFKEFTGKEIYYHGNDTEIYFEEDDFDSFVEKLYSMEKIESWSIAGDKESYAYMTRITIS